MNGFEAFLIGLAVLCFGVFAIAAAATSLPALLRREPDPWSRAPWWAVCFAGVGLVIIGLLVPLHIQLRLLFAIPGALVFFWGWVQAPGDHDPASTPPGKSLRMRASTVPRSQRAEGKVAPETPSQARPLLPSEIVAKVFAKAPAPLPQWVKEYTPLPPSQPAAEVREPEDMEPEDKLSVLAWNAFLAVVWFGAAFAVKQNTKPDTADWKLMGGLMALAYWLLLVVAIGHLLVAAFYGLRYLYLRATGAITVDEATPTPQAAVDPVKQQARRLDGLQGLLAGVVCLTVGLVLRSSGAVPPEIGGIVGMPLMLYGAVRSALSAFRVARALAQR